MKFRLSKKLVVIIGGVFVLSAASAAAAAVFIGRDKLLGPSYTEVNGLSCTTLGTLTFKRNGVTWVRRFMSGDSEADGMTRVRTALRVARAIQEQDKADIVQVSMIDKSGPKERSEMRGRAIGAQVVYIPDVSKAPKDAGAQTYSAYYMEGAPSDGGDYYGMRIDLPTEDVVALSAKLTDKTDCVDPEAAARAAAAAAAEGGSGKKPKTHAPRGPAKGDAAGEDAAGGEGSGGEGSGGEDHGDASATPAASASSEAHGAAAVDNAAGHGEVAPKQDEGMIASLTGKVTGLFFSSKPATSEPAAAAPAHQAAGDDAADTAADGVSDKHSSADGRAATGHGDEKGTAPTGKGAGAASKHSDGSAAATADHAASEAAQPDPAKSEPLKPEPAKPDAATPSPAKADAGEARGLFDQVKGMIFGSGEKGSDKPAPTDPAASHSAHADPDQGPQPPASTHAAAGKDAAESAPSSDVSADGGSSGHGSADAAQSQASVAPPSGSNAADAAGAAWLAKFRGQGGDKP